MTQTPVKKQMNKWFFSLIFSLLCLSVQGASLEFAFQLGEKQNPRLDRLLPDVARYMAFNKDSTKLIAKGMGGSLVEWDIHSRQKREVGNIQAKRLFVYSAEVNRLLIQKENDVTILNLGGGDETHITKGQYESGGLSADGTLAVLSKGEKEFGFWQTAKESPKPLKTFQTTLPVRNGLTLSNNGKLIAVAEGTYRDGVGHRTIVEIWDANNDKQPMRVFNTGEILGVWNVIFSDGGTMLAVDTQLNAKSGICVWNIKTGAQLLNKSGFEAYWTRALAFAPNKKSNSIEYLASGDEKGNLRIWKIPGGESIVWETYPTGIQALAFSPNGEYLAVALWDTTIQILRWKSNEQSQ
jgi:WD40 repeat protein